MKHGIRADASMLTLTAGFVAASLALTGVKPAMASPVVVAVVPFAYLDTSGEPVDQASLHKVRVARFDAALQSDLSQPGGYRTVAMPCAAPACDLMRDRAALIERARTAGAAMLLIGGIHKMSTLVQFMRAEAISTTSGKTVFTRLLTFRGDSDDAWRHGETFLAEQFVASAPRP